MCRCRRSCSYTSCLLNGGGGLNGREGGSWNKRGNRLKRCSEDWVKLVEAWLTSVVVVDVVEVTDELLGVFEVSGAFGRTTADGEEGDGNKGLINGAVVAGPVSVNKHLEQRERRTRLGLGCDRKNRDWSRCNNRNNRGKGRYEIDCARVGVEGVNRERIVDDHAWAVSVSVAVAVA
jgi:hypothetical protein